MWDHGDSPGTRSIVHVEKAAEDYLYLRHLALGNEKPIFLLGHSLGDLLTAGGAYEDFSNVRGVILVSPALADPLSAPACAFVGHVARLLPTRQIFMPIRPLEEVCPNSEAVAEVAADARTFNGQTSYLLAATALRVAERLWDELGRRCIPTLVCHGTADTYTPYAQSRLFFSSIIWEEKMMYAVEGAFPGLLQDQVGDEVSILKKASFQQLVALAYSNPCLLRHHPPNALDHHQ